MKQIWSNLKTKEHQRALLTVSIVFMGSLLFFLLASLEEPIKAEQVNNLPLEISAFEISSPAVNSNTASQPASNTKTQREESARVPDSKANIFHQEAVNDVFSFTATGTEKSTAIFGQDGIELRSSIPTASNRAVLKSPTFNANTQEEGTIGLYIWVDANGKVTRTALNPEASNSGSSFLIELAKKAALTMHYDSKPNANVECVGTTIFAFKKG